MDKRDLLMKMENIALIGAGGKMGCRISDNLRKGVRKVNYVETGLRGIERLAERGIVPTPQQEALQDADIVILAVPDTAIGDVAAGVVPAMKPGALLILLDPAAAYIGKLPNRKDVAYFVAHPCHPPVFNDETTPEARRDFFGGVAAKQAIVCALMQGREEDYVRGELAAKEMYAPVMRSHRITVEQMAMLEPTMAETISSMMVTVLGEAMEEAVKRGVPYEAAKDFMLGHINIQLGIVFEKVNPFSDACLVAIEYGRKAIIKEGWRELYNPDKVYEQIDAMLHPEKLQLLKFGE
ncbi:phosphogluconate dehydrogenase C-terminal domain-containing protein [Cohnella hashimotonis]|uniref:Phosphogluconate dehydrogenase C-terminal domain-containing protein n=1 Tax=Cohnella hashimotonis TaxID=2826895 RepID=A0ABT6TFS1_9BACL|nr:phosphogluconate dehydrogenase C-terminal domain-containing protein [Cohnella hashimotonis]MDI4645143.1 phosphogluconate dehydrogenase C-terminal domain-containing protein [Cohnella hashimotonis]